MCILQQVRYLAVEYNFTIECDMCIRNSSVLMNHGILTSKMTVLQYTVDADVGWYVNYLAYNVAEISGLHVSTMVFA